MKRNILSILLACLMIVSLLVLTGCKEVDELSAKVDKNATDAENAINDAATKADADVKAAAKKAADDLAAAKEKLEKLIKDGDAVDTAAISAAVKDFNAAIAAIDEALNGADAALKAELVADYSEKIETATKVVEEAAAKAIDEAIEDLEAAIAAGDAATAAQLSEAIAAVAGKLANLDTVVQETAITLDNLVKVELYEAIAKVEATATALKTDLEAKIAELSDKVGGGTAELNELIALKADKAAVDAAVGVLEADVDALATDLETLELVVATLSGDTGALASLKDYIDDQLAAAKAAADVAYIVVENWDAATELIIDAIVEIATHFNTKVDADFYYDDDYATIVALYEAYRIRLTRAVDADAVDAVLNAEDGYYAAVEAVDTKADVIYAVLTAEGKTVDEVLLNDAWKKAITDAQALLAAETDADVIKLVADVQKLADEMAAKYAALEGAKLEADALNARVEALIAALAADGFTALNKAEYEDILADIATWDETYGAANAALIVREKVETMKTDYAAAVAAYEAAAKALADKLAAYNAAEYVFVYTTDYTAVTALKAEYDAWAADVVARGFALDGAVEAPVAAAAATFEAGALARANALNTANTEATAIEALIADLTNKLNNFTVVRSEYQTTLETIKANAAKWDTDYFTAPFDAIDGAEKANYELLDHAAVAAVEELYNTTMGKIMELANNLKDALAKLDKITIFSGTDIEAAKAAYTAFTNYLADLGYEIEGLADTATITNTLATKTVEFNNLAAAAILAYDALTVLDKDDVTLASAADIDALKAWFTTYFGLDITTDAELPVAEVVLDATHKVDATTVANAKAAVAAFAELTAAKKAEFDALKAEIDALTAKTAATNLRADITVALANYAAWLDGSKVPTGYVAAQFIPVDATALDAEKAALDTLDAAVKALEAAYEALQLRIKDLVVDYKLITDTAAAQATLDTLNADIKAFIVANDNVDCFTDAEKKALADAQIAIDQAVALAALTVDYNNLIASLAAIADTRVVTDITARADAALAAAEAAVIANSKAGIDLAYAEFDLLAATVAEYVDAIAAAAGDATKEAKIYEAYTLLAARDDMTDAAQLADEINIVEETFAAVLA